MTSRPNPDRSIVKITLLTAGIMTVLGGPGMSPALPSIRDHFSEVDNIDYLVRFVLTLPALLIAISAPAAGYFVDRFGRMRVLVLSLALAGLAGTSGYFASTTGLVLVGRALLGIAVAGIMTSGTTLIADYYSGAERGRLLGLQTGLMGLGGAVLLIFTGVLADLQWNTPFLIHLVALAVLPFAMIYLYEPQRELRCQDDHPPVGESGTCAAESEIRENHPTPPASLTAMPVKLIAFIYLLIVFIQINFYIVPLYLPFYLGELLGATAKQSALAISFLSLSYSLASIFLGKALAHRDRISVLIAAFVVLGLGYSLISLGAASFLLYIGLVIAGIGLGILIPSLYVWLANEAPVAIRGRALGGFTTAIFLGQFLSPILSQPLVNVFDLGRTMLIASGIFVAIVPLLYLGRRGLRNLSIAS
jgi:MFS family permease